MERFEMIILTLAIVLVVVAAPSIYFIEKGAGGLTAFEGRKVADELALDWNQNATLISISEGSAMIHDGHFQIWGYYYVNNHSVENATDCIGITVQSDGETSINHEVQFEKTEPIENIQIDSDELYKMVKDIPELKDFLLKNPSVEVFSLNATQGNEVWTVEWVEADLGNTGIWARVQVDANSGEIISVEVND